MKSRFFHIFVRKGLCSFCLSALFLFGCGGSNKKDVNDGSSLDDEPRLSAEDFAPKPTIARGELTEVVDEARYRSAGPAQTVFSDTMERLISDFSDDDLHLYPSVGI